jgi:ubiquinol-cytochrome c reductase cytochrome b subunit
MYRVAFWLLVADVLILGWCGGSPAEPFYVITSQIAAAYYFAHFLIIVPIISRIETPKPLPNSITDAVLGNEGGSRITATAATA